MMRRFALSALLCAGLSLQLAACNKYGFDRAALDAYSAESVTRAQKAIAEGAFKDEIAPVTVVTRKGETVVDTDEEPGKIDPSKIPGLRAAFGKDGVLTAASSSKISDGAAATIVMSSDEAQRRGLQPLDAAEAPVVQHHDEELRAERDRGGDLGVEHQVAAVADQHADLALRTRQLDAEAAGDFIAHA